MGKFFQLSASGIDKRVIACSKSVERLLFNEEYA